MESTVIIPERSRAEREALVKQWLPLVKKLAQQFMVKLGRWFEFEDLVAMGMHAVWDSTKTYCDDGRAHFGTYAYHSILHRYALELRHFQSKGRRSITVSADETDEDGNALRQLWALDRLQDQTMELSEAAVLLRKALKKLNPNERQVLAARFGKERTLEDISQDLDVSREWVRQLESTGLEKLRGALVRYYPEIRQSSAPTSFSRVQPKIDQNIRRKHREKA